MPNVGEATIRILGDSSAFERTINNLGKQTSGFMGNADRIGTKFGEGVGRATGRALRIGLLAAAGGVALAVGKTLSAGFKRFTTIEDATRSLTLLLGDAAAAGKLLDDTLKVVEGTPFALEDFVDASRNLVANNVQLEKVPRILTAIADAAAAAGGSSEDVNNVVDSFGRMATGATLSLQPIRELEAKGVPALRILANQAGVSAEKMAKDITAGSVDSQKAIDDLTEGILNGTDGLAGATVAYGGAAKEVGNTVSGAFSNMRTAIARAGANIIKVFADSGKGGEGLVRIINGIRDSIDVLGKAGVRLAENFAEGGGLDKVVKFFEELPDRLSRITSAGSFDEFVSNVVDQIRGAFQRIPTEKLSDLFVTLFSRALEGLATGASAITAAVIKHAPAIIKGVLEGLVRAAASNPLNMALFLGALGIPGVGAALAGFFRFLPFGSIVAPLITGLTTAVQGGLGLIFTKLGLTATAAAAPVQLAFQGMGASAAAAAGPTGVGLLLTKLGAIGAAVAGPFAIVIGVAGAVIALDLILQKLGVIDSLAGQAEKSLDMTGKIDLDTEPFDNAILETGAALIETTATTARPKIDADKAQFDDKTQIVDKKLRDLAAAEANPKVKVEVEGESTLDRILGKLGSVVSRVWRGIVSIFHSGGSVGPLTGGTNADLVMHAGGLVPRLHNGTLGRMAGNLAGGLRSDERVAVLQVGEEVHSKRQVAAEKAGISADGSRGHTFIINEVGDAQATAERIVNRLAVG